MPSLRQPLPPPSLPPRGVGPGPRHSRRAGYPRRLALPAAVLASALGSYCLVLGRDGPLAAWAGLGGTPETALAATTAEPAALYLARSTLMALDAANRTGDYAVLHALTAPAFRARNSAVRLAEVFAGQRQQRLDLSIAALEAPQWLVPPSIGENGLLRLAGRYVLPDRTIDFRLAFAETEARWELFEITVDVAPRHPEQPRDGQRLARGTG